MNQTLLHLLPQVIVLCVLIKSVRSGWVRGDTIGLSSPTAGAWAYVVMYVGYTVSVELARLHFGALEFHRWNFGFKETVFRITGIVVLAPIIEEWIFRGVLLGTINRRLTFWTANILQALAFTILHVPDLALGATPVMDGAQIFADGIFFGVVRSRSRSIYPAMACHALGNAMAVLERLL